MKLLLPSALLVFTLCCHAAQTDNRGMHAVPTAAPVTIDGKLDDWDLSGQVLMCYDTETLRSTYSADVAIMYNADALYFGIHWRDPVPMGNSHDPRFQANKGWAGDCVQIRLKTDRISHITAWYYAAGQEPAIQIDYGRSLTEPFKGGSKQLSRAEGWKLSEGAEMAFVKDADGKGYVQEIKIPWALVTLEKKYAAGERFSAGFELLWGEADWPVHRYADNLAEGASSREFFFTSHTSWGSVVLEPKGGLHLPQPAYLQASEAPPSGPVEIRYELSKDGRVTLAVDDSQGHRVRNLIPALSRNAGPNVEHWDGLDDDGKLVPPGEYTFRALHHDGIHVNWIMSFASPGNPSWTTPDGRGGFYGDHTAPQAAAAAGDFVALACPMGEAGQHLIGCNLDGQRLWGLANRTAFDGGHISLATDGKLLWVANEGKESIIYRVEVATGRYAPWKRTAAAGTGAEDQVLDLKVSEQPGVGTKGAGGVNLSAIALRGTDLALCLAREGKVQVLDAEAGNVKREIAIPEPRAVTFTRDGDLLVLSAGKLLRITESGTADFTRETFPDGYGLASDSDGNIYLSVRGAAQNVKVFSPDGSALREIGRPGGRSLNGRYDEGAMRHPAQLAIDSRGRLWVTEETMNPKRTSVWDSKSGALLKDLAGTLTYAGAGSINPDDPTMAFADETVYRIDLATGTWRPVWSLGKQDDPADLFPVGSTEGEAWTTSRAGSHTRVFNREGRTYVFSRDHCDAFDGKQWRSAAHLGTVTRGKGRGNELYANPLFDGHEGDCYAWTDANGDGLVQSPELTFAALTVEGKRAGFSSYYWGSLPGPDGTQTYAVRGTRSLLQFAITGYNGCGAPVYDIAHPHVITLDNDKIGVGDGEGMLMTGTDGRVYLNQTPLTCVDRDGHLLGTYPSRHVSVHGSHTASAARPGYLIGPSSILGTADLGGEIGEVFYMNGNLGENTLFTQDGLWIQSLFKDVRGGFDTPDKAVRGMPLDNTTAGGESFGGNFIRTHDGKCYVTFGGTDARVCEVTGLDTIRRFSGRLTFTPEQWTLAEQQVRDNVTKAAKPKEYIIAHTASAPQIDGKAGDWPDLSSDGKPVLEIQENPQRRYARVLARYDQENLYLAYRVSSPKPLRNAGQDYHLLFKTGDAVDLMLGPAEGKGDAGNLRIVMTQMNSQPTAVLNVKSMPGANASERYGFSSPWRTIMFDRVAVLPEVKLASGPIPGGYFVEAAIPWAKLGIVPQAGLKLRGDVGVLFADSGGTQTVSRQYWSNRATGLVNDVPGEAALEPKLWGTFELGAP